jgi:hypothetical protein
MKKLIGAILVTIYILTPTIMAQETAITLGDNNYIYKNNNWYVIDNSSGTEYLVNQKSMTVKLRSGVSAASLQQLNLANNVTKVSENALGYINLKINNNTSFSQMYNLYNQSGLFDYIHINSYGVIHSNDPAYSNSNPNSPDYQYYLYQNPPNMPNWPNILAGDMLWEYFENGSPSVKVAVIDIGVDRDHWDLVYTVQDGYANYGPDFGWDFVADPDDNDPDPLEEDNHGTSIAGIIAAKTNNGIGCAGIAGGWGDAGVKIIALRVGQTEPGNPKPSIYSEYVDDAIIYAADHGAKVINMSFGIEECQEVIDAIDYAYYNKNCLLVASSGQTDTELDQEIVFPANYHNVMAVAGITQYFQPYGFWNGPLEVVAPSHSIYTLMNSTLQDPSQWDDAGTGTSYSAAEVSGIAALCYSKNANLLQMDVRRLINQYANQDFPGYSGNEQYFGNGIASAGYILDYLQDPTEYYPPQPTSLQISGTVGQHPTLNWPKAADGLSYKIYRANDIDGRYLFQNVGSVDYSSGTNSYSWIDNGIIITHPKLSGTRYYYRITSYDSGPQWDFESITSNEVSTWSNSINKENDFTSNGLYEYKLFDNYPNPFNPNTTISFSLRQSGLVKLEVFNSIGQQVQLLLNEIKNEGNYSVSFDASDLPSGVYFYRIFSGNFSNIKKMMLIK